MSKVIEKKKLRKTKNKNNWIYVIFITTFILALVMGAIADTTVQNLNIGFALLILVLIIAIGILFDMIGMSVASADEVTFHAKATKRQKGAPEALRLVKYSEKVSSVCNDVIGDVCGIISGSVSALISMELAGLLKLPTTVVSLFVGAVVASLTVGGKAIGKAIAAKNAENIMGKVSYIRTKDGICVWSEVAKKFVPLKSITEHYEKVANEMGVSLFDENDE